MNKHRHQEWLKFLRLIDRETPKDLDLHLIVDNYQTHKHKQVKKWLAKHPRFHLHFIPTSNLATPSLALNKLHKKKKKKNV